MLRSITLMTVTCCGSFAVAGPQDPGPSAPATPAPVSVPAPGPSDGVGTMVNDAESQAASELPQFGFKRGWDSANQRFVAVAYSSFRVTPDDPARFANARNAAFQQAMLNAKQEIARYLAVEIKSSVSSLLDLRNTSDEIAKASDQESLRKVISAAKDVAGSAMLDFGGEEAVALLKASVPDPKEYKAISTSEEFNSAVQAVARQEVSAVQCFRTFESISGSEGKVAVIAVLSPNSMKLANAMLGRGALVQGKAKEPLAAWVEGLQRDGQLLYTQGVIQRSDENGELCLVAFGQAAPRDRHPRAMDAAAKAAELNAMQAMRQFAGEMVKSTADQATGYSLTAFLDGTEEYRNETSLREQISAQAQKLSLPGIGKCYEARLSHPATGDAKYAVVVVQWCVSSADAANLMKQQQDSIRGGEGGQGRAGMKSAGPPAGGGGSKAPAKDSGGKGGAGSADDT